MVAIVLSLQFNSVQFMAAPEARRGSLAGGGASLHCIEQATACFGAVGHENP